VDRIKADDRSTAAPASAVLLQRVDVGGCNAADMP
jgi:hypothetical protein